MAIADNPDGERSAQRSAANSQNASELPRFDISHRRFTKEAFVFAGELTTA